MKKSEIATNISQSFVPDYIRSLKVYQAGKPVTELARERGITNITKLASNENPLGPSPFAIREMTRGLWDLHSYPDMHAFALKDKLSKLYKLNKENIILGNGSEGIMAYVARSFLSPNMEVLTSENTFIGFYIIARSVGVNLKKIPLKNDHNLDIELMAKSITPNTKVIYIANPNNPTGTYIRKEEFDYLMDHVPNSTLVILDEAYYEFAKEKDDYPNSMDYRYDNVLTLRTFSKAYGLAGIRLGYGFGHSELIQNLTKVKLPFEPNLIAQLGGVGALEDRFHLESTLNNNKKRYVETFKFLQDHGFKPIESITNFITFKTGSAEASDFLYERLLDFGVIIRPLKANEMPEYVRVSLGIKKEMQHFFTSMDKIMPEFNKLYGVNL